jgi:hypothetical protein
MKKLKFEPKRPFLKNFVPAKTLVPNWYKTTPQHWDAKVNFFNLNQTVKLCVPFLDGLTSGYVITTAGDLVVEKQGLSYNFTWGLNDVPIMEVRDMRVMGNMPYPVGFVNESYAWKSNTSLKIPDGYSALFTHPLNRYDLPFLTTSGVVDSLSMTDGNMPFFLQEGFSGVIPQGTPIAQVIPFKRENWVSELSPGLYNEAVLNEASSSLVVKNWYKFNIWKKKSYN